VLRAVRFCGYCKNSQAPDAQKVDDGRKMGGKMGGKIQQLVGDNSLVLAVSIGLQQFLCPTIRSRTRTLLYNYRNINNPSARPCALDNGLCFEFFCPPLSLSLSIAGSCIIEY